MKNTAQRPGEEGDSRGGRGDRSERRRPRKDLRAFEEQLRELRPPEPPESVWNAIDQRIGASPKRLSWRVVLPFAAVLLVGLTVLFLALPRLRPTERTKGSSSTAPGGALSAQLPGDRAADRDVSLVQINIMISTNPEKLLDHLDSCSRPLRGNEKVVSLLAGLNGA